MQKRSTAPIDERSPDEVVDLNRFIPALITLLANRLVSSSSATFKAQCGIGSLEFRVLSMLAIEEPTHGARISEAIGVDKGAVSRTLKALTKSKLVSSTPSGRRQLVSLTKAGRLAHDQALQLAHERERRLTATLSPAEREQLIDFCRRMLIEIPHVADL